jgi:hypothetical protein
MRDTKRHVAYCNSLGLEVANVVDTDDGPTGVAYRFIARYIWLPQDFGFAIVGTAAANRRDSFSVVIQPGIGEGTLPANA